MDEYITDITEYNKRKLLIYINGEPVFFLYKGEPEKYGVKKDDIFTEECKSHLYKDILYNRALTRCLGLIRSRDHTEAEMESKLKQEYYPEEVAEAVICELKKNNFLNDSRYAESFVLSHSSSKSIMLIKQNLKQKGISDELIEETLEKHLQDNPDAESELILKLLQSKYDPSQVFESENDKYKFRSKVFAFLSRKGFSYEKIDEAVKSYFDN